MIKRLASLAVLFPIAACLAGPSESTAASSSAFTIGDDSCLCNQEPAPPGNHPKYGGCGCFRTVTLEIAPAQTGLRYYVQAGVDWPNPASISFSLQGLPAGVTATWVQGQAYKAPEQDIEGYFSLSASPSAPVTSPVSVAMTLTSEGQSLHGSFNLGVGGVCVPTTSACAPNDCGSFDNGCSVAIDCGGCTVNAVCISNSCQPKKPCPTGTHNCGDGICAKICT